MIDRDKVIKGLECHAVPGGNCLECPYGKYGVDENGLECENKMAADALELLKAQEPTEMTLEEAHAQLEKYGIPRYYQYSYAVAEETPDPCKNCSNHPLNGGSGICNCILGTPKITC